MASDPIEVFVNRRGKTTLVHRDFSYTRQAVGKRSRDRAAVGKKSKDREEVGKKSIDRDEVGKKSKDRDEVGKKSEDLEVIGKKSEDLEGVGKISKDREVIRWRCTDAKCEAVFSTVVIEGEYRMDEESVAVDHNHVSESFRVVKHVSGNVYLPPALWKR